MATPAHGEEAHGIKGIGHLDIHGGGQVVVDGNYAYIGHMDPPQGTSIVDVSDPKRPKIVSQISLPSNTHSHKVRVHDNVMIVNNERYGRSQEPFVGGLRVFDIADRTKPKEIAFFRAGGTGVHRFDFDGHYAYLSPEMEGYVGNITLILDLSHPSQPVEVSQWWLPGQWTAGGETPTWQGRDHRTHHPLRLGNRLYVSLWMGGFAILDISDLAHPKMLSQFDWSPPYQAPTHTALPVPFSILNRKFLVVTDEAVSDTDPPAFLWVVDITDETKPVPVANFQVPEDQFKGRGARFGAHQPREKVDDTLIYVAWFSGGLRVVDIANPYRPAEVASYIPAPSGGQRVVQTNDLFKDDRGLIYIIDRYHGLEILELAL